MKPQADELAALTLRRSPAALTRDSADRVVIMPVETGEPLVLAGPAAVAWTLLEQASRVRDLAEQLAGLYGLEAAEVAEQIRPVLEELVRRGLAEVIR